MKGKKVSKMKRLNKKRTTFILSIVAALTLILVMMVGALGTGAWFSDVETSNNNSFAAGSLDLQIDGKDENVVKFAVSNMRPGNQPQGIWTLSNIGSYNGYLDLENIAVTSKENTITDPEKDAGDTSQNIGELQDAVNLRLYVDVDKVGGITGPDIMIYDGPVGGIAGSYDQNVLIPSGDDIIIRALFTWWNNKYIDDNLTMGDSFELDITFELAQTTGQ